LKQIIIDSAIGEWCFRLIPYYVQTKEETLRA